MAIYQTVTKTNLQAHLSAISAAQTKRKTFYNVSVYPDKKDVTKVKIKIG